MLYQNYALTDGGILSVGAEGGRVRVLLDDRALIGPVDQRQTRQRMSVPLPNGRGEVALRSQADGGFEVLHNRRQIQRAGRRPRKRLVRIGRGRQGLLPAP